MEKVTAVFCSYNRYDMLNDAVRSLFASKGFDKANCDVIIVDNTPPDLRSPTEGADGMRVIMCDEPGLSHARNAGISAAETSIIAFIDDDALVQDGWLPALLDGFTQNKKALICGGKTLPSLQGEAPGWYSNKLATHLSCIDWGNKARALAPGEWVVGANVAYRKEVFERFGLFDPSLGRRGHATLLSNEETALMGKVGLASTFYLPKMLVKHLIPPSRLQQDWFRKRVCWQAISDALSGESYLSLGQAWPGFKSYVSEVPAEYRSLRAMYYPTDNSEEFQRQLQALYAFGVLFSNGFKSA